MSIVLIAAATATLPSSMRAIVATARASHEGDFSNVEYQNHSVPVPGHGEILIKVTASSVNPVDWKITTGGLGLGFPHVLGFDVAGIVAALGPTGCNRLKVGDEVWADLGKTWPLRGGQLGDRPPRGAGGPTIVICPHWV